MKRKLFGTSDQDDKTDTSANPASSDKKRRRKNVIETPKHYPKSERQQLALVLQMTSLENSPEPASPPQPAVRRTPGGSGRKDKIHKRNERGETMLHLCTIRGDLDAMKELVRQGADVNVQDFAGWTPLHEACNHGHQEITRYLLQNGANVNSKGLEDDTPLHDAVTNSHSDLVKLLLEYGANPLLKNKRGERPLDIAEDQAIKDMMLAVTKSRKNSDSEHEWSSPSQSDASDIFHKNLSKIQTSTHSTSYCGNKNSSRKHATFTCDSSAEGSCDEGFPDRGQNYVENDLLVTNGCPPGVLTNSTPKRKIKKSKAHILNSKMCSIKSTPSRRKCSVSSSADSSLSSTSDSSSNSEDNDEEYHNNGVKAAVKVKKSIKRKSISNDLIKRKSLFHNDKSIPVSRNSSTQQQSDHNWRKKSQNLDQRVRSRSHEENKLTSKPNNISISTQSNVQNGTDTLNFNLSNVSRNKDGQKADDSVYDFSPSIEDNMVTTSGISLKREYKDKSSELFDMLCLGKSKEASDIDRDLSHFNYEVDNMSLTLSTPALKDKLSPKPLLNGGTTLLQSHEKVDEAIKPHTSSSLPISKSNGVRNENNHIDNTVDGKRNLAVVKVPIANATLDISRDDMKHEKKHKKQSISSSSPKKIQDGSSINPLQGTVSKKELLKTDVMEKKKKVSSLGEGKNFSDKHPMSGSYPHKKKKKRNRKHSQDAPLGDHKQRHSMITTEDVSSEKPHVVGNIVSSNATKPSLKRTDSTKSLQRKLSIDVKADPTSGSAKKKVRSSDSACSEPGLKNSKQSTPAPKSLKHSSSNHSQDRTTSSLGKRDKTESRKFFLVSDANSSFLSELEKSSRQRLEQEQKLKIQRKRKLQQLKAEAALKAKQNAQVNNKKTSLNDKFSHTLADVLKSGTDKNGTSIHHMNIPTSPFHQDNNSVASPLHEHSNSMSSIDSRNILKRLPPVRSMSQLDPRGITSVDMTGCWGQSPDKSLLVASQDLQPLSVHRSLSFSSQADGTIDQPLHHECGGTNTIAPDPMRLEPTVSHPLTNFTGQLPVSSALPADNSLFSPIIQPVHTQERVSSLALSSASNESFPSNVPISSPMIAARVPDQCLTATQPTGTMSRATTTAFPDRNKIEMPIIKAQCDEIDGENSKELRVVESQTQKGDEEKPLNSSTVEAKPVEDECEKNRILAEREEMNRKEALEIYIQNRLSELGNVIEEQVPKQLPLFIPMEKLNTVGSKNPLHDRMNIYEEWMIIQKQISERRKKYYTAVVIPQAPNCYLEYMTYRGTYLLSGRKESWLSVPLLAPPPSLGEEMRALFVEHERERVKLRLQHATQREKLIVACEQEIMRVHSRAARMLQNQQVSLSACSILLDREVYHLERQNKRTDENNNRVSIRDRFNGRMMLSWLQDVDDKYVKIKKVLLDRQRHESQALHAVQRTEWFLKLQEIENQGQQKKWSESKPEDVSELYVPLVNISDDFPLLPG